MTKRNRFIIVLVCVASFFIISPILVLYSMGYRFDFEKIRLTATGGIYVRTYPTAEQIIIDSKIIQKPGMFSNSVFVQSLLPDQHTVLVQKTGYYDYLKAVPVQEKEVTKLENIILFKTKIQFEVIEDMLMQTGKTQSPFDIQERFIIKNSNLYYSDAPENSELTALEKSTALLKKISAFALQNGNIVWLGTDGFLYKSSLTDLLAEPIKMVLTPIKMVKTGVYKIIANNNNVFVNNNGSLLFLNIKTNELENFYSPVIDAKISPDGKNIVYYDSNNIYISLINNGPVPVNTLLYKSPAYAEASAGKSEKISNCLWLNNYYIIFAAGNKIIISETDSRGEISTITLPQTIVMSEDQEINLEKPEIYFDQQENKLYILIGDTLLLSERIIP